MSGVDMTEAAYGGAGLVAFDVIGGEVPAGMLDLPSVLQEVKASKVRGLVVAQGLPLGSCGGVAAGAAPRQGNYHN